MTAAELAEELEVSERTARRDLEALAMSGVPVYSTAGRGGGWRLIGGARTDLTGLSAGESRALFLALGEMRRDDPMLDVALRKLLVALPDRFRDEAHAASSAIKVDPAGWGQIGPGGRPPWVEELSRAVVSAVQCQITYKRPTDTRSSERVVHPLGLVTKRGVWYLVANTDRGVRTFRVSRVHDVALLDAPVVRPDGFDLDSEWERIVTEVESQRPRFEARVKVAPQVVQLARWMFRGRVAIHSTDERQWTEMTVGEYTPEALAAQLAGLAPWIELLEVPPPAADHLRTIARALASHVGASQL